MYWSVVWWSGGCSWKCYKTITFCSLLTRSTIPCACHAKRHLNLQKWSIHGVFCAFWLRNVLRATTACTFLTSEPPKVVRTWSVLYILTWKCASRPKLVCFVHFDFKMCFAPQRRALFRHLNCQKWSEPGVFLYILTSKCWRKEFAGHWVERGLGEVSHLATLNRYFWLNSLANVHWIFYRNTFQDPM